SPRQVFRPQSTQGVERSLVFTATLRRCDGTQFLPWGALRSCYGFGLGSQTVTSTTGFPRAATGYQAPHHPAFSNSSLAAFDHRYSRPSVSRGSVSPANFLVSL